MLKAVTDMAIEVSPFRIRRHQLLKAGCGNIKETVEGAIAEGQFEEVSIRGISDRG